MCVAHNSVTMPIIKWAWNYYSIHWQRLCATYVDMWCELTNWCETRAYLLYFTVVELFYHRRRVDRQLDVSHWPSCSSLSSGFPSPCTISVHHPPSDFVAFPSVVVLLAGSRVLCSGEPLVPSFWRVTTTWSCSCLLFALLVAGLLAA